ncbi:NAD(P)-dependent oxidoreductase [Microbacterium sp. M28]|uniref:NAD-dependent epimerase/dehydratase family protein n=1 Tax=Microbacterium sp. M28 TaxID=2962064 RepID=UPI0021F445B3|nr:NAD(P)-dependent oxidoreductase [Microbacterium sp. M28]UYO97397.1 NAD(P)-dependent oxidoreductase [Microbacterium sp. M28]
MTMRIAVTGAAGLLGRRVVAAIRSEGYEAVAIDRVASPGGVACDVTDAEALRDAIGHADAVVHLAAITSPLNRRAQVVHNTNVTGSYNALTVAAEQGIGRVVMASSVNAIGGCFSRSPRYDYFAVDETHSSYCEDPYGLSKREAELQADAVVASNPGFSAFSLRYHALIATRAERLDRHPADAPSRDLWGWTPLDEAAEATVRACTVASEAHVVLNLVAASTLSSTPTAELAARYYPHVPITARLRGSASFYDSERARSILDWRGEDV